LFACSLEDETLQVGKTSAHLRPLVL
jgi:hypothetical protein